MKPIIGITMGDPAGIGPEIIAKALNNTTLYDKCNPIIIGDKWAMEDAVRMTGLSLTVRGISDVKDAQCEPGTIDVYDLNNLTEIDEIPYGKVNAVCGKAAGQYIEKAIYMALDKEIDAMVTGPINKESFDLGGYGKKYTGHTEMIAGLTKSRVNMMLASGKLRVIHVTTHVSVRTMVDMIKKERVYNTIRRAYEGCRLLGIKEPKIGVCGLNPHAGEGGLMGMEEVEEIIPAIEQARAEGLHVEGPFPGDTVYPRGRAGTLDVIVAMYHDQGHIPVKLVGFLFDGEVWNSVSGVNITIGPPIIRVSVDHGTAFGKAGKGIADFTSLLDAIDYAKLIAENKIDDDA